MNSPNNEGNETIQNRVLGALIFVQMEIEYECQGKGQNMKMNSINEKMK
jgi:hypothetical protein